jgi:hypothetical protein
VYVVGAMATTGDAPSRVYLVEHYLPGVTAEGFRAWTAAVRTAAAASAAGGLAVRFIRSIVVPADEVAICVVAARGRESVEELYVRAGVRLDRIVDALEM